MITLEQYKEALCIIDKYKQQQIEVEQSKEHLKLIRIDSLGLSTRLRNCLTMPAGWNGGIEVETLDYYSGYTSMNFLRMRNFGHKCLKELIEKVPELKLIRVE